MNDQLVLLAIGVVAAAFILRPLLRGKGRDTATKPVAAAGPPASSDELAELELDRAMGRVSEEDYARWRAELERSAPPAAREPTPPADGGAKAEELVRRWREAPRPECPNCGERPEPDARFCSNCGTALNA